MPNTYIIYTKWVAFELCKQGFRILRTQKNKKFPDLDIYVFEDSPELQAAITNITTSQKK